MNRNRIKTYMIDATFECKYEIHLCTDTSFQLENYNIYISISNSHSYIFSYEFVINFILNYSVDSGSKIEAHQFKCMYHMYVNTY